MATMFGLARLGRDAELKYTAGGDPVASLALAFTYGKKDQAGKRPTQWVNASLWGKRAEAMTEYLVKGQLLMVTLDDVHIREYVKQDQTTGFSLDARVSNVEFAGPSPEQTAPQTQQPQRGAQHARPTAAQQRQQSAPPPNDNFDNFMDDMDIPF